MKKFLLTLCVIFFAQNVYAQEALSYTKVIQAEGKDAKTLYQNSKAWFVSAFSYPGKVIQVDDPSQNMLSAKTNINYHHSGLHYISFDGWIDFNVLIQCKDGKLRVQVINISHRNIPGYAESSRLGLIYDTDNQFKKFGASTYNKVCADIKAKMKIESDKIFTSLETFINSGNSVVNDEW